MHYFIKFDDYLKTCITLQIFFFLKIIVGGGSFEVLVVEFFPTVIDILSY